MLAPVPKLMSVPATKPSPVYGKLREELYENIAKYDRKERDRLFVPVAGKWLASTTDEDGVDDTSLTKEKDRRETNEPQSFSGTLSISHIWLELC